jgi:cytochrome P450
MAHTDGWNDIYRRRPGHLPFPKKPIWWGDLPGRAPSIVSTPIPKDHKRMRDLLSYCFTPKTLQGQEPTVNFQIDKLIEKLRDRCLESTGKRVTVVNIVGWFSFVTFDIAGDLGFAESFHCLESNAIHPWVAELFTYAKVASLVAALRHCMVLFKTFMWSILEKSLEASRANYNWDVQKTHLRLNLEVQREDWMKHILQNSNEETGLQLSLPELENNMNIMIFAGSDTCATVLSGMANYLVKTPHALEALVKEIRSAYSSASEMTFASLQKLTYLNAVVEESLRVSPPNPSGL